MGATPRTSIEQWAALRAVIDHGGFAQAAGHLNRSQSSVSYAVARLQERLGVELLTIEGRKAQLTSLGHTLLAEAIPLIDDLVRLEERGRFLASGHEAEIRLMVDSIFPRERLFDALAGFQQRYPQTRVNLHEVVRQETPDPLAVAYDLAITIWTPDVSASLPLLDIELIAVAHPDHPLLARHSGPLSGATLARHLRVFIQGQDWTAEPPVQARLQPLVEGQVWRVNTVEAAIEAVSRGLCYGWLPRRDVEGRIEQGQLVALPLGAGAVRRIPLVLSFADEEQAGPATRAMAGLLLAR